VAFRGHSPKNEEVSLDVRYAMHSSLGAGDHEGAEVRGAQRAAIYACSAEEAVGTTYEGETPVYRRWKG